MVGLAVDSSGNVYAVDNGDFSIVKFDSNGNFITQWGSDGTGDGQFRGIGNIALDSSGNVYVPDFDDSKLARIQVFAPSSSVH